MSPEREMAVEGGFAGAAHASKRHASCRSLAVTLHAAPPQPVSMDPATPVNVAKGAVLTCEFVLPALTVAAPSLTIMLAPCKQPLLPERSLQSIRSTGGRVIQHPLLCLRP